MITLSNIYIQFGDRILLDRINVVIGGRDRIGLVGRNGAGKSTFLKVLVKEQRPDEGQVDYPKGCTLGFLHQEMFLPIGKSVREEAQTAFQEVKKIENRIEQINLELGERSDYESEAYNTLIQELSDANDRFTLLGGDSMDAETDRVLTGLGFKPEELDRQVETFSGGWKMRIELAKLLLKKPDYLLLDEPTNHLDIESILWLEDYLQTYPGALITISHDKTFLDNVTKRTIEIELGKVFDYKGPYTQAMVMREERRALQQSAFENQQRVIADKERTINRFMAKATKTKMAQSMKKQLDKMDRISLDQEDTSAMNLRFPPAPRSGRIVLDAKKVVKQYGEKMVLRGVDLHMDRGDRVAFVGQNGQGKTTLAKMIVGELSPSNGNVELGHNVELGYYAQNQADTLRSDVTLYDTLEAVAPAEMRPRIRSILGSFLFRGEDVDKKVSVLSGGEKARLALACMLMHPFNLLVMDEPTNHLDMVSKEILKNALQSYDGSLIVVSHDRDFLSGLTNKTIEFRDHQLFHHIGDINSFLEKRKLNHMRQVEQSQSAKNSADTSRKKRETPEERALRKQLQRAVQNAERRIEKLEEEVEKLVKKMGAPGFYESKDVQQVTMEHQEKQKALESAMEEWEKAQEALDQLD